MLFSHESLAPADLRRLRERGLRAAPRLRRRAPAPAAPPAARDDAGAPAPSAAARPPGGLAAAALAAGRYACAPCPPPTRPRAPPPAGFRPEGSRPWTPSSRPGVAARAFPGAVLAVGRGGALVHLRAFGRLSYDAGAAAVATDTLYDLASLTKVVVTTTLAMMLVDEGKLDLDARVHAFFPAFSGAGEGRGHASASCSRTRAGSLWWAPLYKELAGQGGVPRAHRGMDLAYEPGTKAVYSDLGIILLGDVLERARRARRSSELARAARPRVRSAMKDTLLPAAGRRSCRASRRPRTTPGAAACCAARCTTRTPFALGGVAPHAGLFATAPDLARFAAMLLDGGAVRGRAPRLARDGRALHRARGRAARLAGARLGHARDETGRAQLDARAQPGYSAAGSLCLGALVRPHRVHRHLDVDGPASASST